MGAMSNPPDDPIRRAQEAARAAHPSQGSNMGLCVLMSESGGTVFEIQLRQAKPPVRIVLRHGKGESETQRLSSIEEVDLSHNDPLDVWLLIGTELNPTPNGHWSAMYQLEEVLQ